MNYLKIQEDLSSKYSKLPNYKVKFGVAYSKVVNTIGEQDLENLKQSIIAILDAELDKYIASTATTRGGRWGRFGAKILNAALELFKKK
jgi:hypothetical protein